MVTETTVAVWYTVIQMNGVTVPVRYVKFLKKTKDRKTGKSKYSQICVITTAIHVSLEALYKIIQARWGGDKFVVPFGIMNIKDGTVDLSIAEFIVNKKLAFTGVGESMSFYKQNNRFNLQIYRFM